MASTFLLSRRNIESTVFSRSDVQPGQSDALQVISYLPSAVKGRRHCFGTKYLSESEGKAPSQCISGTRRCFVS